MRTLFDILNAEKTDVLKLKLTTLPYSGPKTLKKADLVHVVHSLLQTEHLKIYWEMLKDIEQKAIAEVVFGPEDVFNPEQFFSKYQVLPDFSNKEKINRNRKYTLLGVFFFNNYMPEDLQERFKSFIDRPDKFVLMGKEMLPDGPAFKVRNMEITALMEIKSLLKLIDSRKLQVSDKTRYPGSTTIKAIETILYDGDFYTEEEQSQLYRFDPGIRSIRSFAWIMLIQAGKLVYLSGNTLKLTSSGKKAMTQPPEQVLKNLWESWLETKILDEFRRISLIKGQTGKGKRDFSDLKTRRDVIQVMLSESPTNVWIHFDAFSRCMLSNHLTFEVTDCDPWRLYIGDPQYGSLGYDGCHTWNIMQERYMLCFLFEYVATLGLIDVAYICPMKARPDYKDMWGTDDYSFLSIYDGLMYFKVNDLGKFCLELDENYLPTRPEKAAINIEVNKDGMIHAPSDASSEVIVVLERFGKRQENNTWLLNHESVVSALDLGYSLSELHELFLKYNVALPEDIEALIKNLELKSHQIKMKGHVILFECASPDVARYFASESQVNRYCSLVEKKLLAVPEEKLSKFTLEMKKMGYIVRIKE